MTTTTRNETAVTLNADRAADAEKAILAFACVKEGDTHESLDQTQQTREEWFIDILTDLRHWARVNNLDFAKTVDITARHFEGEVADELEPPIGPRSPAAPTGDEGQDRKTYSDDQDRKSYAEGGDGK